MGKDKAQAIYDRAVAAMEGKTFDLVYVQYDDGLSDEQIATLLSGDDLDLLNEPNFDEWRMGYAPAEALINDRARWQR